MTLIQRLLNLRALLELELGEPIDSDFTIERNKIILNNFIIIEAEWLNKFIIKSSGETVFDESVLYIDAIENFDQYYASKQNIKKFNL